MKKYLSNKVLTLLLIVFTVPFLIAAVTNFRGGLEVQKAGSTDAEWWVNADGELVRAAAETPVRNLYFDLDDFKQVRTLSYAEVSFDPRIDTNSLNSYPYLKANATSPAMVWPQYHPLDRKIVGNAGIYNNNGLSSAEGPAVSPIQVMFKVPDSYRTGGGMVLTAHQDSTKRGTHTTTGVIRIGYKYYFTTPGNYWNESGVSNIPANVGTAGYLLSPTEVTLAISSSDAALEAGKWIVFQYWRIRDENVVDDLRVLNARFQYNPEY
uniref:Uncharacterized protein n=1 Tax=viral metagenome TaxID=1070528 RepID=A0A6M3JQW9_9ZZZZ